MKIIEIERLDLIIGIHDMYESPFSEDEQEQILSSDFFDDISIDISMCPSFGEFSRAVEEAIPFLALHLAVNAQLPITVAEEIVSNKLRLCLQAVYHIITEAYTLSSMDGMRATIGIAAYFARAEDDAEEEEEDC